MIKLSLEDICGRYHEIEISPDSTIKDLKAKISEITGNKYSDNIVFKGRGMLDERDTLNMYNAQNGDIVYLVLGGSYCSCCGPYKIEHIKINDFPLKDNIQKGLNLICFCVNCYLKAEENYRFLFPFNLEINKEIPMEQIKEEIEHNLKCPFCGIGYKFLENINPRTLSIVIEKFGFYQCKVLFFLKHALHREICCDEKEYILLQQLYRDNLEEQYENFPENFKILDLSLPDFTFTLFEIY